jgi:hypothetical protein
MEMPEQCFNAILTYFKAKRYEYHKYFVQSFTYDEGLAAITTSQQLKAINTINEFIHPDLLGTWRAMDIPIRFGKYDAEFKFEHSRHEGGILPNKHAAQIAFHTPSHHAATIRDAIRASLDTQADALLPWVRAHRALTGMRWLITEPAQVLHYMPWLRQVININIAVLPYDPGALRWCKTIANGVEKPVEPKSFIPLTPTQKQFLTHGTQALATLGILKDNPLPQQPDSRMVPWVIAESIRSNE